MQQDAHKRIAFNNKTTSFIPFLAIVSGIVIVLSQYMIFYYAPVEASMGVAQKIFYIHMPLAWWGLFSFFIVFLASCLYLKKKSIFWDSIATAAASIGLLLAVLALVTGMIWGRYAWGIWWTWDARLTTTLIMCFIYAGYLILRTMDMPHKQRSRIAAVIGIIAFLDVPLVFFSARLWSYIHPPSISLDPDMKVTVIVCVLAFGFIWLTLFLLRLGILLTEASCDALSERILLKNLE